MRNKDEKRERRRILKSFKKRIGRIEVNIVRRIENKDEKGVIGRSKSKKMSEEKDIIKGDWGEEF